MNPNDLELDIDNAEIVKEGRGGLLKDVLFVMVEMVLVVKVLA